VTVAHRRRSRLWRDSAKANGTPTIVAATTPAKTNAPTIAGPLEPPIHMTGSKMTAWSAHTINRTTIADFTRLIWLGRLAAFADGRAGAEPTLCVRTFSEHRNGQPQDDEGSERPLRRISLSPIVPQSPCRIGPRSQWSQVRILPRVLHRIRSLAGLSCGSLIVSTPLKSPRCRTVVAPDSATTVRAALSAASNETALVVRERSNSATLTDGSRLK